MITDYMGGEGSTETPKSDYVIYGWPLIWILIWRKMAKKAGHDPSEVIDDLCSLGATAGSAVPPPPISLSSPQWHSQQKTSQIFLAAGDAKDEKDGGTQRLHIILRIICTKTCWGCWLGKENKNHNSYTFSARYLPTIRCRCWRQLIIDWKDFYSGPKWKWHSSQFVKVRLD